MAEEIRTPGPGQMRTLIMVGGNPVLTVPDGDALEAALRDLDLMVAIELYVSETSRNADYILPATTWLEREDMLSFTLPYQIRTHLQFTDPVVPPRDEARQEWQILTDICAELGTVPSSVKTVRRFPKLAAFLTPERMHDVLLRIGPYGDRFGLRRKGLSLKKLRKMPQGILLSDRVSTGVLAGRITHADGRVHLTEKLAPEIERLLSETAPDPAFPFLLFGRRELRSINTWMRNSRKLMAGSDGAKLWIHPDDAEELGLADGDSARVASAHGSLVVGVRLKDEVRRGAASLPHGWEDVNYNALTADGAGALEDISGMAHLNGIPIHVAPVSASDPEATDVEETVRSHARV